MKNDKSKKDNIKKEKKSKRNKENYTADKKRMTDSEVKKQYGLISWKEKKEKEGKRENGKQQRKENTSLKCRIKKESVMEKEVCRDG